MILYYAGTWSPFECTGSTPPPFTGSITMTDDHHAVLCGTFEDEECAAYLLDLEKRV